MKNITGKRSDPVRKIINIAQKTRQHCYTKLGKVTQKCHIQVPKKPLPRPGSWQWAVVARNKQNFTFISFNAGTVKEYTVTWIIFILPP